MPGPVPPLPSASRLGAQLVAAPVSAAACGRVWASQLAYLLARALPPIASFRIVAITRATVTSSVPIQWWPSPGCRLALVVIEPGANDVINGDGRPLDDSMYMAISVTPPTGATVVAGSVGSADVLTGREVQQLRSRASRGLYAALISLGDPGDVTDAPHTMSVDFGPVGSDTNTGLATITLVELPTSTLRPELGEVGLLTPTLDPRNDLHDGATSGIGTGITEAIAAEQDAATRVRVHWQIGTYENTALCWSRSSATVGPLDFVNVGSNDPAFRVRVPRIHEGITAKFLLRVRYNSTALGTFRVVRSVVGAGTSNFDLALPDSGGSWVEESDAITLRFDGTDQQIDLKFHAATDDGSALYIDSIALIQAEDEAGPGDARITEGGDERITESGDRRAPE